MKSFIHTFSVALSYIIN